MAWLPAITRRPRPSFPTVIRNKGRKERSRGMGWTKEKMAMWERRERPPQSSLNFWEER